jgi:hypothetical protein
LRNGNIYIIKIKTKMAKEKSLVEEAIIQMKNLEEAVAENAKGILASTMKEEIKELVKESLSEQEEEDAEVETEDETDVEMEEPEMDDEEEGDDMETDNEDEDMSMDSMDTIDLRGKSHDQVLRVFELMDPEDKIVVTKDGAGNINLKDNESNKEYMIVQEGEEDEEEMFEMWDDEESSTYDEESIDDIVSKVFNNKDEEEMNEMEDEELYGDSEEMDDEEMTEEDMDEMDSEEMEETIYEISFEDDEEDEEEEDMEMDDEEEMDFEDEDEFMMESKMKKSMKPKGVGIGKGPKKDIYSKNPNTSGGFKLIKKKADKTMGTGNAKKGFSYDLKGENLDGEFKIKPKKMETKEASRTYGSGSNFRRGGLPKPKAHSKFNSAIQESETLREVSILREKNEEYRKALNIFRNKLNEVAVFNSNLAYATRLFTEHSTSKQEKINILRRFDGVETIKESKNLYKSIKDELSSSTSQPMNESIERVIEKVPSTGSAANLIESKTYENPQFMRMKDLMTKLR